MLLSACILTRDEPADLHRALTSLGKVPDEIVVVANHDASTETERVSTEFGCKLVRHRWSESFAAARNAGLEAAAGDWVYWIDTDEELLTPDRSLFVRILSDSRFLAYYVRIQDVMPGTSATMSERYHRSIYRRRGDIRYYGRVHEHFEPSLEERSVGLGMKMDASPVRVRHHGYVAERNERRLRRNIELMKLELRDFPGQLYYQIELGRSMLMVGDEGGHEVLAEASKQVLEQAGETQAPIPLVASLLEYALVQPNPACPLTSEQAAQLAQRWFPNSPALLWQTARWHYAQGRFEPAANLLEKVLGIGKRGSFDREICFDQQVFGDETVLNLGVCWARIGKVDKARRCFRELATKRGRFAEAAIANLRSLKGA